MLGCLYGQAIGDALGLGSVFMSKSKVADTYPDGLKEYYENYLKSPCIINRRITEIN